MLSFTTLICNIKQATYVISCHGPLCQHMLHVIYDYHDIPNNYIQTIIIKLGTDTFLALFKHTTT